MDYFQALDPSKLTLALTALSFITSPFAAPPYNLPILLFGTLVQQQENTDGQALQTFTGLLGASGVFDIIWMAQNGQNWFIRLLTIILLLLKVPTFLAFALALRQQRGGNFGGFSGLGGRDLGGATVWESSMPGGFGSARNNGYQNVDDEPAQYARPTAPPPAPPAQPAAPAVPASDGYQTV